MTPSLDLHEFPENRQMSIGARWTEDRHAVRRGQEAIGLRGSCRSILVGLSLLCSVGCVSRPVETAFSGTAMGTTWSVKVVTAEALSEDQRSRTNDAILRELHNVDSKMSTYREQSELSRFNRYRGAEPFRVSAETMAVFQEAQRVGELTLGAFDITVGPLVNAWGFGPDEPSLVPDSLAIQRLRSHSGWDKLRVRPASSTLVKLDPELYCDLSAIAKGYAVDRVSERLGKMGFDSRMIEVGGEVRAHGRNAERKPWRIAIEKPFDSGRGIERVIDLDGLAIATSGDYRNYFERDGKRYSHEIDPRTGRPVENRTASVSVLSGGCATADALATGLIVLGEERGFSRAVELGIAALFLVREEDGFTARATPAFERISSGAKPRGSNKESDRGAP